MDHAWVVEEREVRRQESRRGRRHAWARLDPRRTALVVVDVVPFFFEDNEFIRGTVPRINVLAAALRSRGGTVAWVVPGHAPPRPVDEEFLGADIARLFSTSGGEGPVRERLWPGLDTHDGDVYAEKTASSAFFPGASDLRAQLDTRGVDNLVVCGTVADICVAGTVRDARELGYRVVLVADATTARRDQDLNAVLHTTYRTFGDVRPTAEVVRLFDEPDQPARPTRA